MKFEAPKNPNYCATVVRLKTLVPLEGCDNVVGTPIFGFQAIVNKNSQVDDIGVVFPVECQLSEEFCCENNLYRHGELNKDQAVRGYLEDNRRVRAIKFRGHRSDSLFMPLSCLNYTGVDTSELREGDEFDFLDGQEICRKYLVHQREPRQQTTREEKAFKRVDTKYLPEHYDSENFFKLSDTISPETEVIVTQKLHGTSIRVGNTIVKRQPNIVERIAKLLGAKIQETEYDYIFGSRKVIKDINNPNQNHFYGSDIWTKEGKKIEGMLPENFVVYGELVGWTEEGSPIQKDYTYTLPQGTCKLFVYRVAIINAQGKITDLSWSHVKEFCTQLGMYYVPELFVGKFKDLDIYKFLDKRFTDEGYQNAIPLEPKFVDEGVCVRVDTISPQILKAKSPLFLQHETELLDKGVEDLETQGSDI